MKESLWGYWIVVLGVSVMSVMMMMQNYTTTSEQDYYMLKNVLEASMYDGVDYGYYRVTGDLKMNAEKFVENFMRRFSETVDINKTYTITFYDIYEVPPAASVSVRTNGDQTNYGFESGSTETDNIANTMTGILYTNKQARYQQS